MTRRVLRLKDVKEATGLSRSSIYALRKRGLFPASVRIGPKAVGWFEDEVLGYLKSRPRVGGRRLQHSLRNMRRALTAVLSDAG